MDDTLTLFPELDSVSNIASDACVSPIGRSTWRPIVQRGRPDTRHLLVEIRQMLERQNVSPHRIEYELRRQSKQIAVTTEAVGHVRTRLTQLPHDQEAWQPPTHTRRRPLG